MNNSSYQKSGLRKNRIVESGEESINLSFSLIIIFIFIIIK